MEQEMRAREAKMREDFQARRFPRSTGVAVRRAWRNMSCPRVAWGFFTEEGCIYGLERSWITHELNKFIPYTYYNKLYQIIKLLILVFIYIPKKQNIWVSLHFEDCRVTLFDIDSMHSDGDIQQIIKSWTISHLSELASDHIKCVRSPKTWC